MSKGINKVILVGYVGGNPELRNLPNGVTVTTLSVATSEIWKDNTGARQQKNEWHKVIFFKRLAEVACQYIKKGSQVYVEGKLQTRKWKDKTSGADRSITEIVGNELQILGDNKNKTSMETPPQKAVEENKDDMFDDFIPF